MTNRGFLKSINTAVFYLGLGLLLTSCWHRDEFPEGMTLEPEVLAAPLQVATDRPAFEIRRNDTTYRIEPLYRYDITGLVVSYEHHDANFGLHKRWNDHINVADVCVVWGDNAGGIDLNAFDFWNGALSCNVETGDSDAWNRFRQDQIANNHLLTAEPRIRESIEDLRVGDQVRFRGWLVNYSNESGFSRDTSTTRDDQGNGACETILVEDVSILRSMDNGWRTLMPVSLVAVIGSALLWLVAVARGVF
jgi:hypothetical protein